MSVLEPEDLMGEYLRLMRDRFPQRFAALKAALDTVELDEVAKERMRARIVALANEAQP